MKTVLRTILLAALTATTAAAQRDTAFAWSRRLPDGARFSIKNMNGAVEVRPGSTDRVEVHATIRNDARATVNEVTFDVRETAADDVEICTVYRGVNACEPDNDWNDMRVTVRYVVDLPKGLRFRGVTSNGDILVLQSVVEADASSGNGDIVIRESLGRASASTGNGDVTVAMANGPVRVSSGNGNITVNTNKGPVDANTGNGDIDARMISLPQTPAATVQPSMSFTSGHGSIRVTLPADFNGEIDANSGHGSINSDFELRVQGRLDSSRLRGTVGTGNGPVIKLRSGNGRLEIRKG
jgi:hypothetical protein